MQIVSEKLLIGIQHLLFFSFIEYTFSPYDHVFVLYDAWVGGSGGITVVL